MVYKKNLCVHKKDEAYIYIYIFVTLTFVLLQMNKRFVLATTTITTTSAAVIVIVAVLLQMVDACKISEFPCGGGALCLPLDKYCDGRDDCGDASDEPKACTGKCYIRVYTYIECESIPSMLDNCTPRVMRHLTALYEIFTRQINWDRKYM